MGWLQVGNVSNTFFVLAVCGGKIFSKFLEGGGVPDRGWLSDTFLVSEFFGEKNLQIFSEYIFMYWHSGKIFSNFL